MDFDFTYLGIAIAIGILIYVYFTSDKAAANINHPDDKDIRSKYRFENIRHEDERPIQVKELWVYPMRGIMGIQVPAIKVTKYGVKYDREWALYDKDTLSVRHQAAEVKLTLLRQKIEKDPATK